VAPGSTDMASAGAGSAFNVGIATGALLGGLLMDHFGVRSVALAGCLLTAAALALLLGEPWLTGRPQKPAKPRIRYGMWRGRPANAPGTMLDMLDGLDRSRTRQHQ